MESLKKYLIDEDNYYIEQYIQSPKNNLQNLKREIIYGLEEFKCESECIIEHIEESEIEYSTKEYEQKYKIFDDINSIVKNKDNKIELLICIPRTCDIVKINKIKLSKNIKDYIFDIFITLDNNIILSREELYNEKMKLSDIDISNNNNLIDCSKGEVNIHIILEPKSINSILGSNIYILYSYLNCKNKSKFLFY